MKHLLYFKLFESVVLPSEEELRDCLHDLTDPPLSIEVNIQRVKDYYFIEFQTKGIDLLETTNKIEGMHDMRVFKIDEGLICIPIERFNEIKESSKEFIDPIFNNLEQEEDFFVYNEIRYFKQALESGILWVNYYKMWSVLESKYNLDDQEIQGIIIDRMFEYFRISLIPWITHGENL